MFLYDFPDTAGSVDNSLGICFSIDRECDCGLALLVHNDITQLEVDSGIVIAYSNDMNLKFIEVFLRRR